MSKPTTQQVNDIVCSAVEGGGFYWAMEGDAKLERPTSDASTWFYSLPFNVTDESGVTWAVTHEVAEKGIKARAKAKGLTVEAFCGDADVYDADDAIQMGLFGELVYG